jgi:hypothetical protein
MTENFIFCILDASHALLPATTAAYIRGVGTASGKLSQLLYELEISDFLCDPSCNFKKVRIFLGLGWGPLLLLSRSILSWDEKRKVFDPIKDGSAASAISGSTTKKYKRLNHC